MSATLMQVPTMVSLIYMLNMIKQLCFKCLLITAILVSGFTVDPYGQSLQFSMEVQPELGIEVLQDLNFGTVITNSGTYKVALGDPQMGIFKIKAINTQQALLTLDKPGYLADQENENQRIKVRLHAAYSRIPNEYGSTQLFTDDNLWVSLSPDTPMAFSTTWENGYVYIYGDIEVEDIPQGVYSGTLVLNIEYQ